MNISANTSHWRSNFFPKNRWRASLSLLIVVLLGMLIQGASLAAEPEAIFQKVQQEIAASPKQADAIVKATLENLPAGERQRLASGIFASALKGLGNPTLPQALKLFTTAFHASPPSVGALLKVAYGAFRANLPAFMEAAIKAALADGQSDLIPRIVVDAIILAPDQRAALTALALRLVPEALGQQILIAIADIHSFPDPGPLGGSTNPANQGGNNQGGNSQGGNGHPKVSNEQP